MTSLMLIKFSEENYSKMVSFSIFLFTFACAQMCAESAQSSRKLIPDLVVPNSHPTMSPHTDFKMIAVGKKHRFVRNFEPVESSDQNKTQLFRAQMKDSELNYSLSVSPKNFMPLSEFNQGSSNTRIFNIPHSLKSAEQQESITSSEEEASSEESPADNGRHPGMSRCKHCWVPIKSNCVNLSIQPTASFVTYFHPRFSPRDKFIKELEISLPGVFTNEFSNVSQSFQISSTKSGDDCTKWTVFLRNENACTQRSVVLPNHMNFSLVYVDVIEVHGSVTKSTPWEYHNCSSNLIRTAQRCASPGRGEMENEACITTTINSVTEYTSTSNEKPITPAPDAVITTTPVAMSDSKTVLTPLKTSPKTDTVCVTSTTPVFRGPPATMRETSSPSPASNTRWLVLVVVAVAVLVVVMVAVFTIRCRKTRARPVEPEAEKTRSVSVNFLNELPETDHVSINSLYGTLPETGHVSINSLYGTLPETGHVSINSLYGTLPETGHVSINSLYESMPETDHVSINSLYGTKFESDYMSTNSLYTNEVEKSGT